MNKVAIKRKVKQPGALGCPRDNRPSNSYDHASKK